MENNWQNQWKYFAQYYGQKVFRHISDDENITRDLYVVSANNGYGNLELRPLSAITNEDAIAVQKMRFWLDELTEQGNVNSVKRWLLSDWSGYDFNRVDLNTSIKIYNYLQSKGYAVPWMDLSVEQLVEYGWLKIKE